MASIRNTQFAQAVGTVKATNQTGMANLAKLTKHLETLDEQVEWIKRNVRGKNATEIARMAKDADSSTLYAHETPPTPPQLDSTSVQTQETKKETKYKRPDKIAAKDKERTPTKSFAIYQKVEGVDKAIQINIRLEPTFVEALDVLFGQDDKRQKGFLKTVALNDASANPSSNARCAIVRELLKRV